MNYLKKRTFIELLTLLICSCLYFYTSFWFHIILHLGPWRISLGFLLLLSLIIFFIFKYFEVRYSNSLLTLKMIFFFLLLLLSALLYNTYIEAFLTLENVKDYIFQYTNIALQIDYTLKYKCYFAIKYLNVQYIALCSKYIALTPELFNIALFQNMLSYLDFNQLLQGDLSIADLKYNLLLFIDNYIEYRVEQAQFLIHMYEDTLWRESFTRNFLLFLRNSFIILFIPYLTFVIPHLITSVPLKFLTSYYPAYFEHKALNITTYHFNNYLGIHYVFEGSELEKSDALLLFSLYLLKIKDAAWIYDQPWY